MRIETIETTSRYRAAKECPWACIIAKVWGGYKCFESQDDYRIWRHQK